MDTSGKDGTARGVFGEMSPLGVRSVSWKAPTELERSHDYLWRIHQQVPGAGEVVIFNRSQYEDVLVPVVNQWITPEQQQARYEQLLPATHTPWAPWTIVPADSKTHRNLMIATLTKEVLENLKLQYPEGDPQLSHFIVE